MIKYIYQILCAIIAIAFFCSCNSSQNTTNIESGTEFKALFFDINEDEIETSTKEGVAINERTYSNINLSGTDDFWPKHSKFFMHGIGMLNIPSSGEYQFRLKQSGKSVLRISNVDIFIQTKAAESLILTNSKHLDAGDHFLEIEYHDTGLNPLLILEWSKDDEEFTPIPSNRFTDIYLGLDTVEYKNSFEKYAAFIESDKSLDKILTEQERSEGWELLFDGQTTNGWHTYNKPGKIGRKWKVVDGTLHFEGRQRFQYYFAGRSFEFGPTDKVADGGLDIVTDRAFNNYELKLDWKISPGGNSGIFYMAKEDDQYDEAWKTSPEMQVIDEQVHKDGMIYKHRSGDLYDLIACSEITVAPQGSWNKVRILVNNGQIEQWQNGKKVVEFNITTPEWKDMLAKSKFRDLKDYATPGKNHIALQDHDNPVWFKNIKIREL
jgi:hypothetical protein